MNTTDKDNLRKIFLKKRQDLPQSGVIRKSHDIFQKIMVLDEVKGAKNVSIYIPIKNEVETKQIIDYMLGQKINTYLPKYSKEHEEYILVPFSSWENLEEGPHKILQPRTGKAIDPSLINVAILPGLAFSKKGVRLGYGKGVFDRLFARSKASKIGLAYDFQIVDEIPKEEHDLVMDMVVTESKILRLVS